MKSYLFNNNHNNRNDILETCKLKTQKRPLSVKELTPFENNFYQLVKTIKFRKTGNGQ